MVRELPSYDFISPKPVLFPFEDEPTPVTRSRRGSYSRGLGQRAARSRDRRATARVQIELCCEERSGKVPYYRTTWDVSTFGLSTQYGQAHPLGMTIAVRLHLPDDLRRPVELEAEVVGHHEETGGMRLAFRSPPAETVRRIHRYLFSRSGQTLAEG